MSNSQTTITVRINNDRWFAKTLKDVKSIGGRYDAGSKTWTLNAGDSYNQAVIRKLGSSLQIVNGCPLYIRDQGCPLHGETCAPEYR